jgi:uracil-DNA glycosylase family 4
VPGQGSPHADIMFIGEGPGLNEDKQGTPFVGAAGKFLNTLLESIELSRETVFITNMVKCRPPNNRDPQPEEKAACAHYLDAQIAAIAPKIIVPLGRHALARWFPNESIGKLRAHPKEFDGITLFPLYHPAAALHNGGLRSTIEDDFLKLGALLAELGTPVNMTPKVSTPTEPATPEMVQSAVVTAVGIVETNEESEVAADPETVAAAPVETPPEPALDADPPPAPAAAPAESDEPPTQQLSMF